MCVDKLEEYATEDETANGHGYGCFGRPRYFIEDTVNLARTTLKEVE